MFYWYTLGRKSVFMHDYHTFLTAYDLVSRTFSDLGANGILLAAQIGQIRGLS